MLDPDGCGGGLLPEVSARHGTPLGGQTQFANGGLRKAFELQSILWIVGPY